MSRSVDAWVGKSDDARIPARVRLRVFERHNGVCFLSGRKITASDKWELDHLLALCNGGTHSEENLVPVLRDAHKIKTKADVKQKAKNDRIRKRHLGIRKPSRFPGSRNSQWKIKIGGGVERR